MAARRVTPFADPLARQAAGTVGMRLFLVSLGVLFGASVIGYVSIRLLAIRGPLDVPPLPRGLWLSTLVLVASSGTMQLGLIAARRGGQGPLRAAMAATTALGAAFLAVQALCWIQWAGPMRDSLSDTERVFVLTSFYVLTGLHVLHVLGGLAALSVVTARSFAGGYSAEAHAGVIYCAMYWHFLDAVWLVLFATLLIGT